MNLLGRLYNFFRLGSSSRSSIPAVVELPLVANLLNQTVPANTQQFCRPNDSVLYAIDTNYTVLGNFTTAQFDVIIADIQPADGSLTIRLRKNGVNVGVALVIAAGSAAGNYTRTVGNTFTPGDLLDFSIFNGSALLASAQITSITLT